ncbi:MAG: alcohol dehydrogenase catalytic domain-containing protein [Cellvibrionales bacterium]|nr:alcohol dehydrogenase catalytic domain-containing protein [Cellvibrionales bacterium]
MSTTTSRVMALTGPRKIEMLRLPITDGAERNRMRVLACGVCGSDWPVYQNGIGYDGTVAAEHAIPLGHEIIGEVEALEDGPADIWGVKPGDRILVEEPIPCGVCKLCRTGRYRMCHPLRYGETSVDVAPGLWGGWADYLYLHPRSIVVKILAGIPSAMACMTLPVANGIAWTRNYGAMEVGDTVMIFGPGQQGLGCVIGAKLAGAHEIIVVGRTADTDRLRSAEILGATRTIAMAPTDNEDRLFEALGDLRPNVVLDVTPDPNVFRYAAMLADIGGRVVVAGSKSRAVPEFVSNQIILKELTISGPYGRDIRTIPAALHYLQTHTETMERAMPASIFPLERAEEALKIIGAGQTATHACVSPTL